MLRWDWSEAYSITTIGGDFRAVRRDAEPAEAEALAGQHRERPPQQDRGRLRSQCGPPVNSASEARPYALRDVRHVASDVS